MKKIKAQVVGLDGMGYNITVTARPWLFLGQIDYEIVFYGADGKPVYNRTMKGASRQAVAREARKFFSKNHDDRKSYLMWTQYPWA